ncbi:hypothetical protein I350_05921 [Cryptococcus amylolentus CBS 6273]|uniref:Autophagy-related protein 11 n=1 Tax=Cryptococcus amylolentus CBS 6273 TaxID=1296118 RepID=A0A1E3JQZ4_9TREE|nr:hypothetical protein I350_05921 [Cryptococcus amylolentus CBS 6273]
MDLYHASDGGLFRTPTPIQDYPNIDALYQHVAAATAIPDHHILLFLEDGRELQGGVLHQLQNEPVTGAERLPLKVYLYNRDTFWSDPEAWAAQFQEELQLPPPIDLSSLQGIQHPFLIAHDHLSHLQSLFDAQSSALYIAYANLSQHLQPVVNEFQSFASRVEASFKSEEELIKSSKLDMALLPKLAINPVMLKKREGEEGKERTMGDYVNGKKMEQVRESCRVLHVESVERFNSIADSLDELVEQSESESEAYDTRATQVRNEFSDGLARLEVALGQLAQLIDSGASDVEEGKPVTLDQAMREDLTALTTLKNEFTLDVHVHLRQVASLQSQTHDMLSPIRKLDADLSTQKEKSAFPHLQRLHQIPFAYATAVAEMIKRRDFGQMLGDWTKRLKGTLETFVQVEHKRRQMVQGEWLSQLPFSIPGLGENQPPRVDITVITGSEGISNVTLGYEEIKKLVAWLESIQDDPDVRAVMQEGDEERLKDMQIGIESLVSRLDTAGMELDRAVERGVLHPKSLSQSRSTSTSRTTLHLSSQLRATTKERDDTIQLLDTQNVLVESLQTRQAELQDELVRLRSDLEEEGLARQALSQELEEREKEKEDKSKEDEDLIKGLQAELAQEKDRATDLGVRLQEALLDVDGLRNGERTLHAQLHELQEERSNALQDHQAAQAVIANLESQVAGLRAELVTTVNQLEQAREDRETALKHQTAEAERLLRDQIAEADGDRAVLDQQTLTLTKELEDLKVDTQRRISAAENNSIRQIDGLKAELSLTKAQLKENQRKELALTDELAVAKDSLNASVQDKSKLGDQTREAVALAGRYYEACQRLFDAINSSTTISGTAAQGRSRSPTFHQSGSLPAAKSQFETSYETKTVPGSDQLEASSTSAASFATSPASSFDIQAFADAVTKTIGMAKKWSKSCRQYRDQAKNKISFTNFSKGDLALFLPTRNTATKSWAAFNISAPHNFLKLNAALLEQIRTREWIIARIIKIEEAVATGGESLDTNPFGLADGLRYYTHTVEEYNPHAARPSRRTPSASFGGSQIMTSPQRMLSEGASSVGLGGMTPLKVQSGITAGMPGVGRGRTQSGYFPPMKSLDEQASGSGSEAPGENEAADKAGLSFSTSSPRGSTSPSPAKRGSPLPFGRPLSPLADGSLSPKVGPITVPASATRFTTSAHSPAQSNFPSRASRTSLTTFITAQATSLPSQGESQQHSGRPASVTSTASSYPKGLGIGIPGGKTAPSMAVTTSHDGEDAASSKSPGLSKSPSVLPEASTSPGHESRRNRHSSARSKRASFSLLGTAPDIGTGSSGGPVGAESGNGKPSDGRKGSVSAIEMLRRIDKGSGAI